MLQIMDAKVGLENMLKILPPEKQEELTQYHTLTRSEQINFKKNLILTYGYGSRGKSSYNMAIGGTLAIGLLAYFGLKGNLDPFSDEFDAFQGKLAGAFLGGQLGEFIIRLFQDVSGEDAIRDESQETLLLSTLIFAGSEAITFIDNVGIVYSMYNAYNISNIGFQLYWQNALSAEFDKLYPLNPEVPLMPVVNTAIAGYRTF